MSGEIDNSDYPKHPDDNLTLDEMLTRLRVHANSSDLTCEEAVSVIATLRQCLKQRDDAMGDASPELKADYDAELMAMLRAK